MRDKGELRVRTTIGVGGIDALVEGGVPRGAAILVAGEPGTGKSVLCLQFILVGIREGEPGVYVTADNPGRVFETAAALGWDLRGAVDDGYARVIQIGVPPAAPAGPAEGEEDRDDPPRDGPPGGGGPPGDGGPPGGGPDGGGPPGGGAPGGMPFGEGGPGDGPPASGAAADGTLDAPAAVAAIASAVEDVRAQRIAIDPALAAGRADDASLVADVLLGTLERTHCTTIITGQRTRDAPGLTRLGIEERIVDGIIDLRLADDAGQRHRVLCIRAMHGTDIDFDDHRFRVVSGRGIVMDEA